MAALLQPEDLLGGGLDIDGWSYLKQDAEHRRCADLTDKTYVQRQQFPRVLNSQLRPEERKDVHEIVVGAIEHKATFDTKWIGSGITGRHAIQNNFRTPSFIRLW